LEDRLWSTIGAIAADWQKRFGRQPLLQGLIEGAALPSKNNLRTRMFKRADRDSDYTALPNPIRVWAASEEAA
ncbi:MAG: IucA/IucC family protein, partial [Lysobacter sp.]